MKKLEIYLETSIFNFVFADDAPDKRDDTLILFEEIRAGKHNVFTSTTVTEELLREQTDKKNKMLDLITEYNITVIPTTDEMQILADRYVSEQMISARYQTDALHIAVASVANLDIIVSWNFKHIVRRKTKLLANAVNALAGYQNIDIYSPSEVIENENE